MSLTGRNTSPLTCPQPPSLTALISGSQEDTPPKVSEAKQSSVLPHRRPQ
ncbi:rCG20182 [Rattus norvegicus]|uniref:RCG20182 n=1 Tax=Rattus norvegicus TaxID=10116 RepID=A6JGY0_RAT|nr:rCG20182 [Rattus norvegicus]